MSTTDFIALRLQQPEQVHWMMDENNIERIVSVDKIYTLQDKFNSNALIFVALGGDKGRREVDWETGFYGLAIVEKEPYDIGYQVTGNNQKYFRIDVKIIWSCYKHITKAEFVSYPDTYDAAYIGIEINRNATQAVTTLTEEKAVSILRAVIDKDGSFLDSLNDSLRNILGPEFMDKVTGPVRRFVDTKIEYGQSKKDALMKAINDIDNHELVDETERKTGGMNVIYYGIPGSGKSHKIEQVTSSDCHRVRVIFHPEYTYSDFIGQIKPELLDGNIKYDFMPGPFTEILKQAYKDPSNMYYFIIEEINRGNAAAIFGDTFQLLDRDCDGTSQYGIKNSDVADNVYGNKDHQIKIPSNLTILATMNTSDQNVFALDTAFQRRWEMEHIPNDFDNVAHKKHVKTKVDNNITWYAFAKNVNDTIVTFATSNGMSEDKQLGVYFAKGDSLSDRKKFAEKVLKYLWDDAVKLDRGVIFNTGLKTFEAVVNAHIEIGLSEVLKSDLYNAVSNCNLPDYPYAGEAEE